MRSSRTASFALCPTLLAAVGSALSQTPVRGGVVSRADTTGGLFFIGARVQGDTMPRQFEAVQGSASIGAMQRQGYAIIGVITDMTQADPYTWLGER